MSVIKRSTIFDKIRCIFCNRKMFNKIFEN